MGRRHALIDRQHRRFCKTALPSRPSAPLGYHAPFSAVGTQLLAAIGSDSIHHRASRKGQTMAALPTASADGTSSASSQHRFRQQMRQRLRQPLNPPLRQQQRQQRLRQQIRHANGYANSYVNRSANGTSNANSSPVDSASPTANGPTVRSSAARNNVDFKKMAALRFPRLFGARA